MADLLRPDICVIGGGPGGIAAARAAVSEGVSTVLIEKKSMGGANLAYGALPLAALMAAASLNEALRRGPAMGVTGAPLQVNPQKVRDHVSAARAACAATVSAERLAAEGIRVINARARFVDPVTVAAGEVTVRARRFILAVGGHAVAPDLPGLDNLEPLAMADAVGFGRKVGHLLVFGNTADGLALAEAYRRLGVDATLIDGAPLLPGEDPELVRILADRLRREGVRLRSEAKVERVTRRKGGMRVTLRDPEHGEMSVDGTHAVFASGRKPAAEGLGLEAAGIAHTDGGITVRGFRTSNRHVYAVGDAIAGAASVVRAEEEARAVVRAILFRRTPKIDREALPRATLTDPALASVGLGEAEARRDHGEVRIWRYPLAETDRASADGRPDGLIKVVTGRAGRILGAAALGPDAAEHIALWSLAMGRNLPLSAIAGLAAAYPSRAAAARALATAVTGAGLTPPWRKRIVRLLGKFG